MTKADTNHSLNLSTFFKYLPWRTRKIMRPDHIKIQNSHFWTCPRAVLYSSLSLEKLLHNDVKCKRFHLKTISETARHSAIYTKHAINLKYIMQLPTNWREISSNFFRTYIELVVHMVSSTRSRAACTTNWFRWRWSSFYNVQRVILCHTVYK